MREFNKQKFVADLMSQVGSDTRWRHKGRDPAVSLDCIGFPRWAFIQQWPLPAELEAEFEAYHRRPDGQKFLSTMRVWFDEIPQYTLPRASFEMADLIVIYDRRNPQHTTVACDNVNVVEAYASGRIMKIVYWPLGTWREIAGVFRFPTEGEKAALWQE